MGIKYLDHHQTTTNLIIDEIIDLLIYSKSKHNTLPWIIHSSLPWGNAKS